MSFLDLIRKTIFYTCISVISVTANAGERIGSIAPNGTATAMDVANGNTWVTLTSLPSALPFKQLYFTEGRVGALDTAGNFYAQEGASLNSPWVLEAGSVTSAAMSGTRIGVLLSNGSLAVKDGTLYASWTTEATVAQFALTKNRILVVDSSGNPSVKEGGLAATWTPLTGFPAGTKFSNIVVTPNRIGLLSASGSVYVYDGPVQFRPGSPTTFAGTSLILPATSTTTTCQVTQFAMTFNRIAVLCSNQSVYAAQRSLVSLSANNSSLAWNQFEPSGSGATQIVASDQRIGVLIGSQFQISQGAVTSPSWVLQTGSASSIALSEYAPYASTLTGATENIVFSTKGNGGCGANDYPDTPVRAFVDSNSTTNLVWGNDLANRRWTGTTGRSNSGLSALTEDCSGTLMKSEANVNPSIAANPANHADGEWIYTVYTPDGTNIYALVHNEYNGADFSGMCPSATVTNPNPLACWTTSTTLAVSAAKGGPQSFAHVSAPPAQSVAWGPFPYDHVNAISGLSEPSSIINGGDGYYYATVWAWNSTYSASVNGVPQTQTYGPCLMRTSNLADPTSWRTWNKNGFVNGFYPNGATCDSADFNTVVPATTSPTQIFYSSYLSKYVMVTYNQAVYMLFSDDLINWDSAVIVGNLTWPIESAGQSSITYAYPSVLDPTDTTRNFEQPGQSPYLYYTVFPQGTLGTNVPIRDLRDIQIQFAR